MPEANTLLQYTSVAVILLSLKEHRLDYHFILRDYCSFFKLKLSIRNVFLYLSDSICFCHFYVNSALLCEAPLFSSGENIVYQQ